ncbi:DUF3489 domain-containing protein [Mesorhizobium sp. M0013]|uniref:DUF3489 domain-containing protein n=1 Tax=Mesorhizobium sp. M0013 TaxID=2956841 RepID=UPI00333A7B9F
MKSYNVKSNAKRFAKQLAAKFPGYSPDEPAKVSPGAKEWFPALAAPFKTMAAGIPEEISSTAYVNGKSHEAAATIAEAAPVMTRIQAEVAKVAAMTPAEVKGASKAKKAKVRGASKANKAKVREARKVTAIRGGDTGEGVETTMTIAAMKAAVADLPPTRSTPEQIAERRAARAAARAANPKPAKVTKTTRADTIIALVSRPNGATAAELQAATEWQPHTLRGYIAGTLRKRGHNITLVRIKGEKTRYVIPAGEVEA